MPSRAADSYNLTLTCWFALVGSHSFDAVTGVSDLFAMRIVALFAGRRKFPKCRGRTRFVSRPGSRCELQGSRFPSGRQFDRVGGVPLPPEVDHVLINGTKPLCGKYGRFSRLVFQ